MCAEPEFTASAGSVHGTFASAVWTPADVHPDPQGAGIASPDAIHAQAAMGSAIPPDLAEVWDYLSKH